MSKLSLADQQALYTVSKSKGYAVMKRVFKENLVEQVHLEMEQDKDVYDIYFHQGEIRGIKEIFIGIDEAVVKLKKAEEASNDADKESTTNE